MKNIFKRLLNVKGMVVEDVSIDDSPLRDAPVLVCVLSSCYRPVWREFSFRKSGRF